MRYTILIAFFSSVFSLQPVYSQNESTFYLGEFYDTICYLHCAYYKLKLKQSNTFVITNYNDHRDKKWKNKGNWTISNDTLVLVYSKDETMSQDSIKLVFREDKLFQIALKKDENGFTFKREEE